MRQIILASTSPRRKEILAKTRLTFKVEDSNYEEDLSLALAPTALAEYLSVGKARAVAARHHNAIIIAADTLVAYNNKALGKPKTAARAREMLAMLNGRAHHIVTGVTIIDMQNGKTVSFHETIKVFMKRVSPEVIEAYIKTGEPLDKAGAYALQGIGAVLFSKIDGDFFGALGLPLSRLAEELKKIGVSIL